MILSDILRWVVNATLAALVSSVLAMHSLAQTAIGLLYFYGNASKLTKLVGSSGHIVAYYCEAIGQMTSITRTAPQPGVALAIFDYTPKREPYGALATIQGQDFSSTASAETAALNGITPTAGAILHAVCCLYRDLPVALVSLCWTA